MNHTYTSNILSQLTQSGYVVNKSLCNNTKQSLWTIADKHEIILQSKALGCLVKKAAKDFGLVWEK